MVLWDEYHQKLKNPINFAEIIKLLKYKFHTPIVNIIQNYIWKSEWQDKMNMVNREYKSYHFRFIKSRPWAFGVMKSDHPLFQFYLHRQPHLPHDHHFIKPGTSQERYVSPYYYYSCGDKGYTGYKRPKMIQDYEKYLHIEKSKFTAIYGPTIYGQTGEQII